MFDAGRFVAGIVIKGNMIVVAEEMGKISNEQAEILCKSITHMNGFEVAEACGLKPVAEDDPGLTSLVISFIATERKSVMDFLNGKENAINHIVGKIHGRMPEADPGMIRRMIEDRIFPLVKADPLVV